jgi:prepilin peptidase CpaA
MDFSRILLIVCVVVFTAVAAACDARAKKLPNLVTVPAFVAAIVFHLSWGAWDGGLSGAGRQLLFALGGFATGFGILFVLWMIGKGGGGDVKFMGALGTWLGAVATLQVFLVSAVLVVLGAGCVMVREFIRLGFRRSRERYVEKDQVASRKKKLTEEQLRTHRRLLPFGVPAALATWLVLAIQVAKTM